MTAAFAGAPAVPFTTFGAAPNRDGVVLGFNATTAVAERTSIYFRYEGQVSGADNMHSGTVGLRFTW